jgi:hypothetical protein
MGARDTLFRTQARSPTRACPHVAMKVLGHVVIQAYSHVHTRFAEAP